MLCIGMIVACPLPTHLHSLNIKTSPSFLDPPSRHNCLYPSLTKLPTIYHNYWNSHYSNKNCQVPCEQGRIFFGMLQMATQSLQKQFGNILNNKLWCIYTIVYQFYDTERLCTHMGVFEVKILTYVYLKQLNTCS